MTTETIFQATFDNPNDRNPNVKGTQRLFTVRRRVDGVQLVIEGDAIGYDGLYPVSDVVIPEKQWEGQKGLLLSVPFTTVSINKTGDGGTVGTFGWPFKVIATMEDGSRRTATVYGNGSTYRDQLADGTTLAKAMFPDAHVVEVL